MPECTDPGQVILARGDTSLRCADAEAVQRYVEILAGRTLSEQAGERLRLGLARWMARPEQVDAAVDEVRRQLSTFDAHTGLDAAALRSSQGWALVSGEGIFREAPKGLTEVAVGAISAWSRDDRRRLVLTEMDIEGWISYASLCREVQGAGAIRLSVADRVIAYRIVKERFERASAEEQAALVSVGPFWTDLRGRWKGAPYEIQQRWIARAPLPPPMLATSKAYLEVLLDGDPRVHARVLHEVFGPMHLSVVR